MGLENRRSGNVSEGSNPSLSAIPPVDATVSDARISRCSVSVPAGGDGTEVGTTGLTMPVAQFIALITFDVPEDRFQEIRKCEPDHVFAKYTYFAQCSATGAIKIGRSFSPDTRMKQIKNAVGSEHRLLATIRGGENEPSYHTAFRAHRLHGEWFSPHPEILAEIDRLNSNQEQAA